MRVGVVGVGAMGQHHARVYAEMPGCELVGLYDIDPARAQLIADKFGVATFDDLPQNVGLEVPRPAVEGRHKGDRIRRQRPSLCVSE